LSPVGFDSGRKNARPTQSTEYFKKENHMNTQDENQDTAQTSARDSFPEPQTIPSGWDTSTFSPDEQDDDTVES
jgi:hypothetical protein